MFFPSIFNLFLNFLINGLLFDQTKYDWIYHFPFECKPWIIPWNPFSKPRFLVLRCCYKLSQCHLLKKASSRRWLEMQTLLHAKFLYAFLVTGFVLILLRQYYTVSIREDLECFNRLPHSFLFILLVMSYIFIFFFCRNFRINLFSILKKLAGLFLIEHVVRWTGENWPHNVEFY